MCILKKGIKLTLSVIILQFALAATAHASIIDPPADDKSVEYLRYIYGDTVNVIFQGSGPDAPDTILGAMSMILNIGCLLFSGIIIGYTALSGVLNSAHEGQVMGKAYNSMWVPIRTSIAIALMLPLASGFSVMQIGVLWFAGKGIGLADSTWNAALDHMNTTGTLYPPVINTNEEGIAINFLERAICMAAINHTTGEPDTVSRKISTGINPKTDKYEMIIRYTGNQVFGSSDHWTDAEFGISTPAVAPEASENACGTAILAISEVKASKHLGDADAISNDPRSILFTGVSQALIDMEAQMYALAHDIVNSDTPFSWSGDEISVAADTYRQTVNQVIADAVAELLKEKNNNTQWVNEAKKYGWITAGTWYVSLARLNEETHEFVKGSQPIFTPIQLDQVREFDAEEAMKNAQNIVMDRRIDTSGGQVSASAITDGSSDAKGIVTDMIGLIIDSGIKHQDPMFAMQNIGHNIIIGFEVAYAATATAAAAAYGARQGIEEGGKAFFGLGAVASTIGIIPTSIIEFALKDMLQGLKYFAFVALPMAIMLAFYLPTLPYIMWTLGVAGWFVLLIEATIAAPIWAAAHSIPEGDGAINNHAKAGYMICLSLFMRPTLMLFGLFASMLLMIIMGRLVIMTFEPMMASVNYEYTSGIITFFSMLAILTGLMVSLAHRSFGLIHEIPDKVLRYIGAMNENLGEAATEQQGRQIIAGGASRTSYSATGKSFGQGGGSRKGEGRGDNEKQIQQQRVNNKNSDLSTA